MIDRDQLREALAAPHYGVGGTDEQHLTTASQRRAIIWEAARLVADPNTLVIRKVDGEWPEDVIERMARFQSGHLRATDNRRWFMRLALDAALSEEAALQALENIELGALSAAQSEEGT